MMNDAFDVIVIGGGPAGVTAALRACELGAKVALVERGRLGGTCTNDGCAPTRVLAKAARLVRDAEQFEEYGLDGAVPTVNLRRLLARTQQTVYRLHQKKQLLKHLAEAGATTYSEVGPAAFASPYTLVLSNGATLEAETFILCAGGRARRLTFPGSEHTLTHSDVWTLEKVPRSVAIVGGAATGCQLASIFAAFGAKVFVLDVANSILGAEDGDISQTMAHAFYNRGITVITGIDGVERVEKAGEVLRLHYRKQDTIEQIAAEAILLAVGWVGNVKTLNLEAAGVTAERGYVLVDDHLRTTADHVYAAGDITGRMMLVQSASYEARIAAENAVRGAERTFRHYVVPHGGFTDPEYGSVGLTEVQARARGDCAVAVVSYADLDRAVIDDRTEGFFKLIADTDTHEILGAHAVGEQALEVIQMVATGMAAGLRVAQLADLELAYPTFAAIIGLAARRLARDLQLVTMAPEWRTLHGLSPEWERRDVAP